MFAHGDYYYRAVTKVFWKVAYTYEHRPVRGERHGANRVGKALSLRYAQQSFI